jgi:hypothetical protein
VPAGLSNSTFKQSASHHPPSPKALSGPHHDPHGYLDGSERRFGSPVTATVKSIDLGVIMDQAASGLFECCTGTAYRFNRYDER